MFQTFLPNYWAVSRGGEWVQRYILKSSAKFQTSWTISTKPQSWCFINNQHHNAQGCIIFLYLCDPQTKTNEYSWCNLGYKSGIPKTSAVNQAQKHLYRMLGMFHCHSTERDTNPHKSLQKTKKMALKKAHNCTSNRILNCTSFNKPNQAHTRCETADIQKNTDSWKKRLHQCVHTNET